MVKCRTTIPSWRASVGADAAVRLWIAGAGATPAAQRSQRHPIRASFEKTHRSRHLETVKSRGRHQSKASISASWPRGVAVVSAGRRRQTGPHRQRFDARRPARESWLQRIPCGRMRLVDWGAPAGASTCPKSCGPLSKNRMTPAQDEEWIIASALSAPNLAERDLHILTSPALSPSTPYSAGLKLLLK